MSQEIIAAQFATLFGIVVVLVLTGCIAGGNALNTNTGNVTEPFSSFLTENFSDRNSKSNSSLHVNGCGPGCWDLKSGERERKSKQYQSQREMLKSATNRIPDYAKQLPIGHLSTMGSPLTGQASCTSNINGVQRLANSNPYGELVKKYGTDSKFDQFTQSYASCEFGANNIFDENQLKY